MARRYWIIGILVLVFVVTFVGIVWGGSNRQAILERELSYLQDIPEVQWVRFEDNTVHIGVSPLPGDIAMIAQAAAVIGNRAIDFGVHVWVHPANDPNKFYGETTARYGKISDPYGK